MNKGVAADDKVVLWQSLGNVFQSLCAFADAHATAGLAYRKRKQGSCGLLGLEQLLQTYYVILKAIRIVAAQFSAPATVQECWSVLCMLKQAEAVQFFPGLLSSARDMSERAD